VLVPPAIMAAAVSIAMTIVMPLLLHPVVMLGMVFVRKIARVAAVTNGFLVVLAFERGIFISIDFMIAIRCPFIDHDLMRIVEVVAMIPCRKRCRTLPASAFEIKISVLGHVVVHFDIRKIIIFNAVISCRSPDGLSVCIEIEIDVQLCRCCRCYEQSSEYCESITHDRVLSVLTCGGMSR
jgi:hypothetical protein